MKKYVLILCGLALSLSISGVEIFGNLLFLIGVVPFLFAKNRPAWKKSPLDIPVLIGLVWTFFCAVISGSLGLSSALSKQGALLLFYVGAHGLDEDETATLCYWFLVGAGIAGLWGLLQAFSVPFFSLRDSRAVGSRSHPLTYAESLLPAFFILMGLLGQKLIFEGRKVFSLWKEGLVLALVSAGLILSRGRGVWLGIIAGLVIFILSWPRRYAWRAILGLGVFLILLLSLSTPLRQRALSIFVPQAGSVPDKESSSTRLDLWKESVLVIKEHPFMGVGLRGAKLKAIDPVTGLERIRTEAHSIYLQAALDAGFIGLGLLIWIFCLLFRSFLNSASQWRYVSIGALVAMMVAGLTESWMGDKEVAMIFWLFAGIAQRKKG